MKNIILLGVLMSYGFVAIAGKFSDSLDINLLNSKVIVENRTIYYLSMADKYYYINTINFQIDNHITQDKHIIPISLPQYILNEKYLLWTVNNGRINMLTDKKTYPVIKYNNESYNKYKDLYFVSSLYYLDVPIDELSNYNMKAYYRDGKYLTSKYSYPLPLYKNPRDPLYRSKVWECINMSNEANQAGYWLSFYEFNNVINVAVTSCKDVGETGYIKIYELNMESVEDGWDQLSMHVELSEEFQLIRGEKNYYIYTTNHLYECSDEGLLSVKDINLTDPILIIDKDTNCLYVAEGSNFDKMHAGEQSWSSLRKSWDLISKIE